MVIADHALNPIPKRIMSKTMCRRQPLIAPQPLDLTAAEVITLRWGFRTGSEEMLAGNVSMLVLSSSTVCGLLQD